MSNQKTDQVLIDFWSNCDWSNVPLEYMFSSLHNIQILVMPNVNGTGSEIRVRTEELEQAISEGLHSTRRAGLDIFQNQHQRVYRFESDMSPRELLLVLKELLSQKKIISTFMENAKDEMEHPFILYAHSMEVAIAMMEADWSIRLVLVPNRFRSNSKTPHTILMRYHHHYKTLCKVFGKHKCTVNVHSCYPVDADRAFIEQQLRKHTNIQIGY